MSSTVLDQLILSLKQASSYNRHDLAEPEVILWTDGEQLWRRSVPRLLDAIPELLVLEPKATGPRTGPSTYIRYLLKRQVFRGKPVVYLPGVPRQKFRSAVGFPEFAKHLFALQYQGQFWSQQNGKDWTPYAFLTSAHAGLSFDLARDQETQQALQDQLDSVLLAKVENLSIKRLEADDFHKLVANDPVRSLLQWIGDPNIVQLQWKSGEWQAFKASCQKIYGFDPEKDGVLTAVEKLAKPGGAWDEVWQRFCESPKNYGGVRKALGQLKPAQDFFDRSNERVPAVNRKSEEILRSGLEGLSDMSAAQALESLLQLADAHVPRASSVWAVLGEVPLALAVTHLKAMAEAIKNGLGGSDWSSLAQGYIAKGHVVDASSWKALAAVRETADLKAVSAALRAVYLPWLVNLADQTALMVRQYPNPNATTCRKFEPRPGLMLMFVDGLRCDLALELRKSLADRGLDCGMEISWSALPSLTATSKPAWHPMASQLAGDEISESFEPLVGKDRDRRALKTSNFRTLLAEVGFGWVDSSEIGDPGRAGWTEVGNFDHMGHDIGAKLAWRIDEELVSVVGRIRELLENGWKEIVLMTDHGWLMIPGGLPKVDLPKHLTVARWGRCALAQPGAQHGFPQVSWFWGGGHAVALAPGVSVFREGLEYAHGGLSLQETLTPILKIRASMTAKADVRIAMAKWVGLRLHIELAGDAADCGLDIRTRPADASTSLLPEDQKGKRIDTDGKVALLVASDDFVGQAAMLVVTRAGQVIAKHPLTIGENNL